VFVVSDAERPVSREEAEATVDVIRAHARLMRAIHDPVLFVRANGSTEMNWNFRCPSATRVLVTPPPNTVN
jgi:hypothetical protein